MVISILSLSLMTLVRKIWVYFLRKKSVACDVFKMFKTLVEKQSGYKIKVLITNIGQKYVSCTSIFEQDGIQYQLTTKYTP